MNTPENREQMAEIFFETFNVDGLYIGVQAVLALYAGAVLKGKAQAGTNAVKPEDLTGTVIDSGDGVTNVIPVVDSFVVSSCIKQMPLAGRDITQYFLDMMRERGEKFQIEDSVYLAREAKVRRERRYGSRRSMGTCVEETWWRSIRSMIRRDKQREG